MAAPTRITVAPTRFAFTQGPGLTGAEPGEYVDAQSYDELAGAHYAACEALAENPGKWSFGTLVHIAWLILDGTYPADIFKGDGADPDPGVAFVALLRKALDALPEIDPAAQSACSCWPTPFSSATCSRCTKGCEVDHPETTSSAPTDDRAGALAGDGAPSQSGADGDQPSPEPVATPSGDTVAFTDREGSGGDPSRAPAGTEGSDPKVPAGGEGPAGVLADALAESVKVPAGSDAAWAATLLAALNRAGYLILTSAEVDAIVLENGGEV